MAPPKLSPVGLKCEYRVDPLGIDERVPRLSWALESEGSVGVEYEGEALRSGSRCVWKVRVWDAAGDPSPYGGPAVFETGLLERSDWKGDWISLGDAPD